MMIIEEPKLCHIYMNLCLVRYISKIIRIYVCFAVYHRIHLEKVSKGKPGLIKMANL